MCDGAYAYAGERRCQGAFGSTPWFLEMKSTRTTATELHKSSINPASLMEEKMAAESAQSGLIRDTSLALALSLFKSGTAV